jgi:hypothetical protein
MSRPSKMPAIRQSSILWRLWSWFRGLFRSGRTAAKHLNAAAEEATVPFSSPVVSKRVPLADLPNRPRLLPSMVTTARLPVSVKEAPEPTTEAPPPPELLSLPLPVSVSSLRMARFSLPIPVKHPTLWTPEETQRFEAPRLVSSLELEKEKSQKRELESAIYSMPDAEEWEEPRNVVIDSSQTMLPVLPADMAPPTLVQERIQDSPELLDLIKEFEEKHGGSEP